MVVFWVFIFLINEAEMLFWNGFNLLLT
jgi:hypothetical protein